MHKFRLLFLVGVCFWFIVPKVMAADIICTWDIKVRDITQIDLTKNRFVKFSKIIDNMVVDGSCDYFTSHAIDADCTDQNILVTFEAGRLYVMKEGKIVRQELAGKTFDKSSYDYLKTLRRCDIFY